MRAAREQNRGGHRAREDDLGSRGKHDGSLVAM